MSRRAAVCVGDPGGFISLACGPSVSKIALDHNDIAGEWNAGWFAINPVLYTVSISHNRITKLPADLFTLSFTSLDVSCNVAHAYTTHTHHTRVHCTPTQGHTTHVVCACYTPCSCRVMLTIMYRLTVHLAHTHVCTPAYIYRQCTSWFTPKRRCPLIHRHIHVIPQQPIINRTVACVGHDVDV